MDSASDVRKPHRYLLPVAAACLVVVLVSFSGCLTGMPGSGLLNGLGISTGSSTGTSTGSSGTAAYTTTPVQGSGTAGQGTGSGLTCPAPYQSWTVCPNGNCYDLTADPANCGACGNACAAGRACTNGLCTGGTSSGGSQQGTASLACPAPYESWTVCPDYNCYDLTMDPSHCGSCANACTTGQTCTSGQCTSGSAEPSQQGGSGGLVCPAPHADWTACTDGYCYNLTSDPANCGSCGNACATGASCTGGTCHCPSGYMVLNGICININIIKPVTINPDILGQIRCSPLSYCDGDCVNLQTNRSHCGDCDTKCSVAQICSAGKCVINPALAGNLVRCIAPMASCNGDCVNLQTNRSHCGDCDTKCSVAQICSAGECVINPALAGNLIRCIAPMTSCSGSCVDTSTDESNCGSCGNACATGATCTSGSCHCPTGYLVYNGKCIIAVAKADVSINPAIIHNIVVNT